MPMRRYIENGTIGPAAADEQIQTLTQAERLAAEAEQIAIRRQYVQIKIDYWQAVARGDDPPVESLTSDARSLAKQLRPAK